MSSSEEDTSAVKGPRNRNKKNQNVSVKVRCGWQ